MTASAGASQDAARKLTPSLLKRLQAQSWSRFPITQPFANDYDKEPLGWKVAGKGISDMPTSFGLLGHWHRGTDYGLPMGTPVTVVAAGLCTYSEFSPLGYGGLVTIEGSRYKSRYAHLSVTDELLGTHVYGGQLIGLSGSTGNSTGAHLHFEVYDKLLQCYVDPQLH